MPDGRTHLIAGTICGACASVVIQDRLHENKELDFGHFLFSTGTGTALSRLPDILEPAIHPNHRAFFHSFAFGAMIGFGAAQISKDIRKRREKRKEYGIDEISGVEILLGLVIVGVIVILLHLLMDGFTKKGLPIA